MGYKKSKQKSVETSFIVQPDATSAVPFKLFYCFVCLMFLKMRNKHTGFLSLKAAFVMSTQSQWCETGWAEFCLVFCVFSSLFMVQLADITLWWAGSWPAEPFDLSNQWCLPGKYWWQNKPLKRILKGGEGVERGWGRHYSVVVTSLASGYCGWLPKIIPNCHGYFYHYIQTNDKHFSFKWWIYLMVLFFYFRDTPELWGAL